MLARTRLAVAALVLLGACRRGDRLPQGIVVTRPVFREVVQRDDHDRAVLPVRGSVGGDPDRVEARLVVMPGGSGKPTDWTGLPLVDEGFDGAVEVSAGGWYALEVRAWKGGAIVARAVVEKVGVGEVFIVAGQSNAANAGSVRLIPAEDRVSTWNGRWWQWAGDPQPMATGRGGSPWPALGDLLVRRLGVPVGFMSVAVGGSPVHEWLKWATWRKHGECYVKFRNALGSRRARAVLWHQGETDAQIGTSAETYSRKLGKIIAQSRRDAGYEIPWVVAGASYFGPESRANEAAIRSGQRAVCDGKLTFAGPETDDLLGGYRSGGIHFNGRGLREHARRWSESLAATVLKGSSR